MSHSSPLRLVCAPVLALAIASPVAAQSVSVTFSNTDLPPIPLLDTSTVSIDADGNLDAKCVLDGDTCAGITSGGPVGNAPVATLTRSSGTGNVDANTTFGVTWSATNSPEVCIARSSPAVNNWNGNVISSTGGTTTLTAPAVPTEPASGTPVTLSIECYNDAGSSVGSPNADLVLNVMPSGGVTPPGTIPACTTAGIQGDAQVQPNGFEGHRVPWTDLMFGAEFPGSPPSLAPVGSFTLRARAPTTRGPTMNGRYIATSFVAEAGGAYKFGWVNAQTIQAVSYQPPRAARSAFVSISPCAGDLRNGSPFATDPWLKPTCRGMASSGSIKFGTTGANGQCALVPGQEYFVNIAFVDPSDGLDTAEHTCTESVGGRCEINAEGL